MAAAGRDPATGRDPTTGRDPAADLLLAATRRICEVEQPTREDVDLYREAFYAAIHRLDIAARQSIAVLLARSSHCPRPIALFLAMDVPAVAHAVLKHSPVLGERDLERIAEKTTPIHLRLMASRPHLGEGLVRRLAENGDADIHAALLANPTLVLNETLRERLAAVETGPLRRTVRATQQPTERQASRQPSGKPVKATSVESRLKDALSRTRPGRTAVRNLDAAQFRTAFEAAAMKRDRRAMVQAMRSRFGLTHATAVQALDDRTGDALQVMMKAEGFDAASANRIVMLAIPAVGLSPAATERALALWERLQVETCRTAFAVWPREDTSHAEAARHQPSLSDADGVRRDAAHRTATPAADEVRRTG